MFKSIIDFFTGNKETDWSQEDREGSLKLLVLIMYSDDRLTDEEGQMIHRQIGQFDWKGVHNEDYFLSETIRHVRDLPKTPESIKKYVEDVTANVSDPEVKSKIITLCEHLSESDGEVNEKEKEIVAIIRKVLKG